MNHISRISQGQAALAVIDMQEAFRKVIPDFDTVASRISKAVEGARLLNVPVDRNGAVSSRVEAHRPGNNRCAAR